MKYLKICKVLLICFGYYCVFKMARLNVIYE
jgi:hypothetical protein